MTSLSFLACGCAASDGSHEFAAGWREGRIERIFSAPIAGELPDGDCRRRHGVDGSTRYADVTYRSGRLQRSRVVPLSAGSVLAVQDLVYVNVDACVPPALRR